MPDWDPSFELGLGLGLGLGLVHRNAPDGDPPFEPRGAALRHPPRGAALLYLVRVRVRARVRARVRVLPHLVRVRVRVSAALPHRLEGVAA